MAGEEGFKELSAVDPEAENLLQQAMEEVGKVKIANQPKLRPHITCGESERRVG
jgi:hypothetical protein